MKILCICPIGIGNYLLFYPACALLKKCRSDLKLHLLALRNSIAEFARGDTLWDDIHVMDPAKMRDVSKKITSIKSLRDHHFDASLSFFPTNRYEYNLLPFLCGIPERFAFSYCLHRAQAMSFLNNRLLPVDVTQHDLHQNIRLSAMFLERDLHDQKLVFSQMFTEEELTRAHTLLYDALPVRIAIHAGSSVEHGMDAKRWEPERFGSLADRICHKLHAEALIVGGPEEDDLKKRVASVMTEPHRVIAPVHLKYTIAILKQCVLCLCNDSGIMHCAAIAGVPVAAVFGPTDERRNGPVGINHLILRKPMNGFPLWTARNVGVRHVPKGCVPNASIMAMSADDAWAMVEPWLGTIDSIREPR